MSTSVCRICLEDNIKMFCVLNDPILDVYEKLTSAELNSVDRPRGVCYICLALLQRCCRFSEMARRSEQILTNMFNSGIEVTKQNILTLVCGVKDNNIIDLTIGPTHLTTVNGCDTVETSAVSIKQEPLTAKEENTLPVDIVIKEESTEYEEITDINCNANDSVFNELSDVTLNNLLSVDEQYEEYKHIDDNLSQLIFPSSLMKKMDKQIKVNLFPCDHCTVTFSNKSNLISHIKLTHRKVNNSKTQDNYFQKIHQSSDKTRTDRIQPKVNLYPCEHCAVTFQKKYYLISHKKLTHQKLKLRRNKIQKTKKIPKKEKVFHGKLKKTRTGGRHFICEICGKRGGVSLSALQRHIRTHTGERPFPCTQCDRRFPQKKQLMVHIQRHNGEKPHSCEHCHKKFVGKGELIKHLRIHTGEKPYSCTQCGKSFTQSGYLALHKRLHTGEKPYECHQCDQRFSNKAGLSKHVKTHTSREKPYACQQCNKRFHTNFGLNRHYRIHTGEKPYACELCPKSFSQRSDLVIHVRTHTGEKPYSCTQCDRTFPTSSSLVKHKRTHTGENM